MVSDSNFNASMPNNNSSNASKDLGKKKRANRSAKLKQCKLDARREQWLSQAHLYSIDRLKMVVAVKNKGRREETNADDGEFNGANIDVRDNNKKNHQLKDLETGVDNDRPIHHECDSESPAVSPVNSISSGNVVGSGSSSSSSSSGFSGGCCSESITEEYEGGESGEDACSDSWETWADAIVASENKGPQLQSNEPSSEIQAIIKSDELIGREHGNALLDRSKSELVGIAAQNVANPRAWRPDDASRPQSLPNLNKQHSLPVNLEKNCDSGINPWNRNHVFSAPTSCPICYEDLDLTDSSFLPCSCGFRLCLFCHKRISEEDGRCPGCRKPYDPEPVEKETCVTGGSLTIRLNRLWA